MEEIFIGVIGTGSLQDKIFMFLIKLMGQRDQLRMNHWQTTSYAEHKLTDDILEALDGFVDKLGENALGAYGRPKINTISNNVTDIAISSTEYVLDCIDKQLKELINIYKEEDQEGILAILGEMDSEIKKFKYLASLI